MLVPRNVEVYGRSDQITALAARLRSEPPIKPWVPAHDEARRVRPYAEGEQPLIFQHTDADEKRALLWFFPKGDHATVGNIVPLDRQKLDPATYNAIAKSFVDEYLDRLCTETGCRLELGAEQRTIRNSLSTNALKALEAFSDHANKGIGNAHPEDARRWADFVIQCFRNGNKINFDVFREWMREKEWEDSVIDDLYDDFETGFEILKQYEETR